MFLSEVKTKNVNMGSLFSDPINTAVYTDYTKNIKEPMDLSILKRKMDGFSNETRKICKIMLSDLLKHHGLYP